MTCWDEIHRSPVEQVVAWAEAQPWARAMAACRQDAEWHAEGDVWTHTRMVVAELAKLSDWTSFDHDDQRKLLFTALFHDAGKPATTLIDPETGRTRSLKHAQVGVEIARQALRELGCDLAFREAVAALVRYHGRPPFLLEKADPAHEVISLSWLVDHRLLHAFALADNRGRVTHESNRSEDNLHLWKLAAEEAGCFGQPYAFANDHARFRFYRSTLSSLHYTPQEDYRCTATLMAGLPGAGKDTWLARHRPELPVVSLDELRDELEIEATDNQGTVIQQARESCRAHLRAGRDFALNATNVVRTTRKRWIDLFADYHARIEIVYVEPPLSTIFQQNERRVKKVPAQVIRRLVEKLDPPTWAEAHAVTLVG